MPTYHREKLMKKLSTLINKKNYFPITKIKSNLFFTLGVLLESISTVSLHFRYENKIRLNTSFKLVDNLLKVFESGNALNGPYMHDLQNSCG